MLIYMQKTNLITHFFLNILQRNSTLVILGKYEHVWPQSPKMTVSIPRNLWCLIAGKNQLHPSRFPWDIEKILQNCYFRCFRHTWLRTLKMILSTCRKLPRLSTGRRISYFYVFFSNIAKICKLLILGTNDQLPKNFDFYLHAIN